MGPETAPIFMARGIHYLPVELPGKNPVFLPIPFLSASAYNKSAMETTRIRPEVYVRLDGNEFKADAILDHYDALGGKVVRVRTIWFTDSEGMEHTLTMHLPHTATLRSVL